MSSISSGLFVSPWRWRDAIYFSPCSPMFLFFVYLSYLSEATDSKDEEIKVPKRLFLGMYWCVSPQNTSFYYIYRFFFPSSTPDISSQTCDNDLSEPYTHLILSLIHNSLLTLMFHLHVPETDMWHITMNYKCMLCDSFACFCYFGCQHFSIACR